MTVISYRKTVNMSVEQAIAAIPAVVPQESPVASESQGSNTLESIAKNLEAKANVAPVEAKAPPVSTKRKYNIVVDGNAEDVEFDPGNEEEVKRYLQKGKSADRKFQEAASLRQAAMEFIADLKKNPRKVLSDPNIGLDVRKFAEQVLQEEITEMEKSPEQRERDALKKELEEIKAQKKEQEESAKKANFEKLQIQEQQRLETDITTALDMGGIPKTPRTVRNMAEMMMIALENNINLSAKEVAQVIKSNNISEFKEILNNLSDDQMDDFLGKEVLARIRKKNMARAKAASTNTKVQETVKKPEDKESKGGSKNSKTSYKSFFGF